MKLLIGTIAGVLLTAAPALTQVPLMGIWMSPGPDEDRYLALRRDGFLVEDYAPKKRYPSQNCRADEMLVGTWSYKNGVLYVNFEDGHRFESPITWDPYIDSQFSLNDGSTWVKMGNEEQGRQIAPCSYMELEEEESEWGGLS